MKADLAIYTHVLGVPGQYKSLALMLSHKMDFHCCANGDGFCKSSHIFCMQKLLNNNNTKFDEKNKLRVGYCKIAMTKV